MALALEFKQIFISIYEMGGVSMGKVVYTLQGHGGLDAIL